LAELGDYLTTRSSSEQLANPRDDGLVCDYRVERVPFKEIAIEKNDGLACD